jgi:hypothetical protein
MGTTERPGGSEQRRGNAPHRPYVAPSVTYLGTLRELTQGGTTGPSDGVAGGAGGTGSIGGTS